MPQSTALLNWASLYSTISPYLSSTTGSSDWLRIFISPDPAGVGHFITHGIDFGASYNGGARGLVPANDGTLNKTYLRGDGWAALWTSAAESAAAVGETLALQLAAKEAYLQSAIVSAYDIKQWIAQSFAANNAMRFKGTITINNGITTVTEEGTLNSFPTNCVVGDTYKIIAIDATSRLIEEPVSTGDMLICIKSGSGDYLNDPQYWAIVQDNVEHLITYTLNGNVHRLYAQTSGSISIYAPTTYGTTGYVLIAQGQAATPVWTSQANLIAGQASKVVNALTAGLGIAMYEGANAVNQYDGSAAVTIRVSPATSSLIGGVIIDDGTNSENYNKVTNTSHTPYPTITVDSNGQIYLTRDNVVNALGYDPISAIPVFTDSIDGLVPMSSAANKSATPAMATTYLLGADAKWYQLPASSFQGDRRIIQLGGTTIIDAASGNALNVIPGTHINIAASQSSGNYTGAMTFDVLWRDVQVRLVSVSGISQNVASIGDNDPLVFDNTDTIFMLGEEVTVGLGASATKKTVIKSYITWYNMDTGEYEMI